MNKVASGEKARESEIWIWIGTQEKGAHLRNTSREPQVRVLGPKAFVLWVSVTSRRAASECPCLILTGIGGLRGERAKQWRLALTRHLARRTHAGETWDWASGGVVSKEICGIFANFQQKRGEMSRLGAGGDADARVHRLIELASRISEVPIKRISERAANYLEESTARGEGAQVLELLVEGLRRSDGHTLRFRDLVPHLSRYFDPEDPAEALCN